MTFGVFVFPDVEELDFVGPWEIVGTWGKFYDGPARRLVVAEADGPLRCANGLSINPDVTIAQCPPLDYLLVPGGQGSRVAVDRPAVIEFIQREAARARAVLSVCTGAFLLERAGLLRGQRATTHWGELAKLRTRPVEVVEERFVRNGTVWTAAGVSAGIDMTLAFIASEAGDTVAGDVQMFAEYYPSDVRYGRAHLRPEAPRYVRADAATRS
ncbi:MAG: DJ-1/PfpI family protein [Acidobacteria bacterium]|nr:DJ-1/PfpI family protein [Acidobacteriota bacterium]